ncbi:MAG: hypothetical protein GX640_16370, partial [Fibrobacter sp.]|nr:hypothetical protein [Fibrobacter sp.]
MNRLLLLPVAGILFLNLAGCNTQQNTANKAVSLSSHNDSISYMIGQDIGKSFKSMKVDSIITLPVLLASIEDVITGKAPK